MAAARPHGRAQPHGQQGVKLPLTKQGRGSFKAPPPFLARASGCRRVTRAAPRGSGEGANPRGGARTGGVVSWRGRGRSAGGAGPRFVGVASRGRGHWGRGLSRRRGFPRGGASARARRWRRPGAAGPAGAAGSWPELPRLEGPLERLSRLPRCLGAGGDGPAPG